MNQKLHWKVIKNDYYKKIILPTEKELSDHNEFLKKKFKKKLFLI